MKRQTSRVKRILEDEQIGSIEEVIKEKSIMFFKGEVDAKLLEPLSASTYMFLLRNFYKYLTTLHFKEFHAINRTIFIEPVDILLANILSLKESALLWTSMYQKLNQRESDKFHKDTANIERREEHPQCRFGVVYKQVNTVIENHQSST